MICSRCLRCRDHFLIRCVKPAVPDIFHDCSLEQPGILQYHSECITQFPAVEILDIMSIKTDCSAVYIIETHKQFYHRRFSGSGWSYDCDFLSRFYAGTEIIDDDLLWIVSKMDMIKCHCTCNFRNIRRMFYNLLFFLFLQKLKYTLGCCRHRLYLIDHLRDLLDRLCEVFHILDERLDITDCDRATDCKQSTCQGNTGIT